MSPGLRTCCQLGQQPEGLTSLTGCHPLQQKKVEERAEEQIGGSCLEGRVGLCQVEQRDENQETFLGQIAEPFSVEPYAEDARQMIICRVRNGVLRLGLISAHGDKDKKVLKVWRIR